MQEPSIEWLSREIVSRTQDAVVLADPEGVIRLWNSGAEAMFGHGADEALGKTLDLIIPERLRARHWEGFERTMATGETRYAGQLLAVPAVRKDGSSLSVEFTITVIRAPSGELVGLAAILRDVTERWKRDREREKRLAALEASVAPKPSPDAVSRQGT